MNRNSIIECRRCGTSKHHGDTSQIQEHERRMITCWKCERAIKKEIEMLENEPKCIKSCRAFEKKYPAICAFFAIPFYILAGACYVVLGVVCLVTCCVGGPCIGVLTLIGGVIIGIFSVCKEVYMLCGEIKKSVAASCKSMIKRAYSGMSFSMSSKYKNKQIAKEL